MSSLESILPRWLGGIVDLELYAQSSKQEVQLVHETPVSIFVERY
jgi:hypothetical protein